MAQRFEDTNGLFGKDDFVTGTCGNFSCDWCGTVNTKRQELEDGRQAEDGDTNNPTVCLDNFGKLGVCHFCFAEIEATVLVELPRVLPWFLRLLQDKRKKSPELLALLVRIREELNTQFEKGELK